MANVEESYNKLIAIAVNKYKSHNNSFDFHSLKESFKTDIDSNRRFNQINDITSLIEILEKRDLLSSVNISPFYLIYNKLNISQVHLEKHRELLKTNPSNCQSDSTTYDYRGTIGPQERMSSRDFHRQRYNDLNKPDVNNCSPLPTTGASGQRILSERVVKTVCSQIGHSWKSLARCLRVIQECTIEMIEEDRRITSNEVRARMIMDEYQQNINPVDVKTRLLKALKLARRMDIHDQVQKIFFRE